MRTIAQRITQARRFARALKQQAFGDMLPTLIAGRGGDPVMLASHVDVAELLCLARTIAAGYCADELCLVTECLTPTLPSDPPARFPSRRFEEDVWILECQVVIVASRDLSLYTAAQPFDVGDDGTFWSGDIGEIEVSRFQTALLDAFAPSPLEEKVKHALRDDSRATESALFVDPARGRRYLDIVLTKTLDTRLTMNRPGGGAMVIAHNEEAIVEMRGEGLLAGQYLVYHSN